MAMTMNMIFKEKKLLCLLCVVNSFTFEILKKCVLCLHKNHLKPKHERYFFNSLNYMPAASTVCMYIYIHICVFVCVRASTRVCGMWFRFIAFVYSTHYQPYAVFYFSFIFHELKNILRVRNKKRKTPTKWRRTEQQQKNDVKSFFFSHLTFFRIECCCICINVCHMRVIKWAHGFVYVCWFSLLFRLLFLTTRISIARFNERISFAGLT